MPAKQRTVSLRKALADKALLGTALPGPSWQAWRVLLTAAMGEELTPDERAIFKTLTGREREPGERCEQLVCAIGRRGGKSKAIATLASYVAGLCRHPSLTRGEKGVVLVVSPDLRQSDVILDYTEAIFRASPMLSSLVETRTARSLRLTNGIEIETRSADHRRLRGLTLVLFIADEAAFFPTDANSASPDTEIVTAAMPALSTTGGMIAIISSPYARRGELWRTFDRHFGVKGDPLIMVAQGASRTLNPTLDQRIVDRAIERDAAAASAEYLGQFRTDVESFISLDVVRACVIDGRYELPRVGGVRYTAFVDPSGGSADSMTVSIAHTEGDRIVLDLLRECRAPLNPDDVTKEFTATIKAYGISRARGDRYAARWPAERFGKHGIEYIAAAAPKSDIYRDALPLLNAGRVELLDHSRLIAQLVGLERRTARGGKDSIDHAPGAHDDVANAACGALVTALRAATLEQSVPMVVPLFYSKNHGWSDEAGAVERGSRTAHDAWSRWYYNGGRAAPGTIREW
jgi:hypothetical protein